ncbi:hypothetical protein [Candidatus Uabimicrobium sp. HlEnr_7]|uniref:hypothetical protein n=1 Tax=Candidatus Uabimicrobium helgolandensis TaxID=3095367 RepID=UPI003558E24C
MVIIDCHSRYIISYDISVCQDVHLCPRTFEAALANSKSFVSSTYQGLSLPVKYLLLC